MYFNLRRKKKVLEQVGCGIQQVKSLVTYVSDTFNKQISCSTLKRLLREADYIWKRMKHSLKDTRNELDFRYFQEELQRLRALELQGEIDLFYFDETGINLTPSIPYAWIPKGVRSLLPCTKSKNINILGFMNQDNKLYSYAFEGAATSEVVIKCMDDFCDQITKKTVVVLDNAAIHKSNAVKSKMKEWKEKGLWLQFIPAYCPELNLIELLWKQLKYKWTKKEHYTSFEKLWESVCEILENVGKKYRINFN